MSEVKPRERQCYCINVRRAANALTKFYDRALKPTKLTISQYSLLNDIKILGICNKSELAQYAKLDRTTLIRNLNTLKEKGFIINAPEINNRPHSITLSNEGESIVNESKALWEQAQLQIKNTIGVNDIEWFEQTLKKIELLE